MNPKTIIALCRKSFPAILGAAASGGVVLTGWLSYEAGKKEEKGWKKWIPPVIAGLGTICCIAGVHNVHLKKEATLAAAVAFYKAAGEDFEDAVFNKFSDAGLKENVMMADRDAEAMKSMTMKIKIWEPYTNQWFEANRQEILWAELTANKMLAQRGTVTLNDVLRLYSDPSLKIKKAGNKLGWSWDDELFNDSASYYYSGGWIDICPQFEEWDGRTCFVMDYGINPSDISECV